MTHHPKNIEIADFNYVLPDSFIAKYPLPERDQSKLLIYRNQEIETTNYASLSTHLQENTFLVFNNTKVVAARLLFEKTNGGKIEIFCLEPHQQYGDITTAMLQKGNVIWICLVGGAKKWKESILVRKLRKNDFSEMTLTAIKMAQLNDSYLIELSWDDPDLTFAEMLHQVGEIPLPPYINRKPEELDNERYQTIYAEKDGSVAAPTAGLHFTESLFEKLKEKNIQHDFVTLHVGAGTFKPVKSKTMENHEMHAEFLDISKSFIKKLLAQLPHNIIPVGTTSLRTIESLYWLGVKTILDPHIKHEALPISQWDPYTLTEKDLSAKEALESLLRWMEQNNRERLFTKTQIIIAPGYRFKIINALITNFHQPQSTLLLLVAAITGEEWRNIYNHALENNFRFLSYGDGSLLWLS